jgi:hypothetical protein
MGVLGFSPVNAGSAKRVPLLLGLCAAAFFAVRAGALFAENTAPGSPGAGQPRSPVTGPYGVLGLDVYGDEEKVHALFSVRESRQGKVSLYYRVWRGKEGEWSEPKEIPTGPVSPRVPHRGDEPQIAGLGKKLVALWTIPGSGYMGSGPMRTAFSSDGGNTWELGPNPADDGNTGGHEFADLACDREGTMHLAWLDSRTGKQGVIYTRSLDGGHHWEPNHILDPETCSCCWVRVAAHGHHSGVFVLYRDAPIRDMRLAWSYDGGLHWTDCGWVGRFGWNFQGCPHWGGALAFSEVGHAHWLHALVQTGKPETKGIYFLSSDDHGLTWTSPLRLGDETARYVDLASDSKGGLLATWAQWTGEAQRVMVAHSRDAGIRWTQPRPISPEGLWATHPRVCFCQGKFLLAWTQTKDQVQWDWAWKVLSPGEFQEESQSLGLASPDRSR